MADHILRLERKAFITSECWTYYKFAIMQTSSLYRSWLANHMSVYMDQDGEAMFGENGARYPLSYYSDILEIKDGNMFSVPSDKIVDYLKNQIDQGYYIVLDLNYNELYPREGSNDARLHESLIYGYTEEDEFVVPVLVNGNFRGSKIPFERIRKAYEDILEFHVLDLNRLYYRRHFFFGITLLKLRDNDSNENACFDFIMKLMAERDENVYSKTQYGVENNCHDSAYYTGHACMRYLIDLVKDLKIDDPDRIDRYKRTCRKINEHQSIICESMKWYADTLAKDKTVFDRLIEDYDECCRQLAITVLLFYKLEKTSDIKIAKRIVAKLEAILAKEKEIINEFILVAIDVHLAHILHNNESIDIGK